MGAEKNCKDFRRKAEDEEYSSPPQGPPPPVDSYPMMPSAFVRIASPGELDNDCLNHTRDSTLHG
uniref:Uncharacterized protein n=1 Tax=Mus spicilegus TaxID=10103 RepID=A0A8C6I1F9_MUSSI